MSGIGLNTLVLNADYSPINLLNLDTVPVESAIRSVYNGLTTVVDTYDRVIKTHQVQFRVPYPSVIAKKDYVHLHHKVNLTDRNLLFRDDWRCVYCGIPLNKNTLTWDHYIPQSKGGSDDWDNILCSCSDCNQSLGDIDAQKKNPSHKPYKPTYGSLLKKVKKYPIFLDHESWIPWIGHWEGEIIIKGK